MHANSDRLRYYIMSVESPIIREPHPACGLRQSAPPRKRGGVGGGVQCPRELWLIKRT